MTDNRKSGIALIAGSIGAIVTMAIHPTGGNLPVAQVEHLAVASAIAHSLGMVSIVAMVLGAFRLTWRLRGPDRLAFAALVVYVMAAVAILIAATVSGFIVPGIWRHMVRETPDAAPMWRVATFAIFEINQAFAGIYSVAASLAIALWAAAALRHGSAGRGLALYGLIVAPLLILLIAVGHIRMDVHGMAAVVVVQAIWFIGVGLQLYREAGLEAAAGPASLV